MDGAKVFFCHLSLPHNVTSFFYQINVIFSFFFSKISSDLKPTLLTALRFLNLLLCDLKTRKTLALNSTTYIFTELAAKNISQGVGNSCHRRIVYISRKYSRRQWKAVAVQLDR